jgi:TonB family protein
MFDFAISQSKKRQPTQHDMLSWALSFALHLVAVLILIAHPELLLPGLNRWLHEPILVANGADDKQWRTLTFVGKGALQQPSPETLRKFAYDWDSAGKSTIPPIRLRWGDEPKTEKAENKLATPIRPVPGPEEPKPQPSQTASNAEPVSPVQGTPAGVPGGDEGTGAGKTSVYYLPAPAETKAPEPPKTADAGTTPRAIPNTIPPPPPAPAPPAPKPATAQTSTPAPRVFENEQKAIRSEGTGFFDTKGFPLGAYANVIIERIKGNWYIPSNLKSSQGRTTVIFFIGKDGRYTNAHIVTSSGSTSLDLAALNAVLVSNPFPPLPNGFPGEQVGAKFVFSYNERQ